MDLFRALRMPSIGAGKRQTESGVFLVDRRRHWLALEWLLWLNVEDDVTYKLACECLVPDLPTWMGSEGLGVQVWRPDPTPAWLSSLPRCVLPVHSLRSWSAPPPLTHTAPDGDKDTFRAAFFLAGRLSDFYQVPFPLGLLLNREVSAGGCL